MYFGIYFEYLPVIDCSSDDIPMSSESNNNKSISERDIININKIVGGGSIITASIDPKIGEGIVNSPSKKYIDSSLLEHLSESLHFTGNSGIDLLLLIQTFQKLQLFFLFVIAYNFILVSLKEEKVEIILLKILPVTIVSFISKYIKFAKKYVRILIICFFIILVICNIQSYYYLNFFIENLDGIIETYFKK